MVNVLRHPLPIEARAVLEGQGWLSLQPPGFRESILALARPLILAPRDKVYGLDDPDGGLYAVCEGFIDVLVAPRSGVPRLVHVAGPGWWVGDAALISGTPRRAELTGRTRAVVAHVPKAQLLRLCADDPDAWRAIARITVSMFDHAVSIITAGWSDVPMDRVRDALLRLMGEGLLYGRGGAPVSFPVSQSDIAELAGLSRNATGAVLRELQAKGAIEIGYRRLTIGNRNLL